MEDWCTGLSHEVHTDRSLTCQMQSTKTAQACLGSTLADAALTCLAPRCTFPTVQGILNPKP